MVDRRVSPGARPFEGLRRKGGRRADGDVHPTVRDASLGGVGEDRVGARGSREEVGSRDQVRAEPRQPSVGQGAESAGPAVSGFPHESERQPKPSTPARCDLVLAARRRTPNPQGSASAATRRASVCIASISPSDPHSKLSTPSRPPSEIADPTQDPASFGTCGFDPHLRHRLAACRGAIAGCTNPPEGGYLPDAGSAGAESVIPDEEEEVDC